MDQIWLKEYSGPKETGYQEIKSNCNDLPSGNVGQVQFLDIKCRPSGNEGQVKKVAKCKNGEILLSNSQVYKWPNAISGQVNKQQSAKSGQVQK